MKKINIRLKCIATVWFTCFLLISGIKAQKIFLPSDISGLQLWLTGDSVSISSPPFIDKCFDLSLAKNDALPQSLNVRPSSVNSILNGHKTMRFDGTDDFLAFTIIPDIRTVFWVLKEDSTATNENRVILGCSAGYDFYRGDSKEIWSSSYSSNFVLSGTTRLNGVPVNGSTTILPPRYSILSIVTTGNVKADYLSRDRALLSRIWDGEYAELLIYNKPLSATEVQQVENYLRYKYAPPVALGADRIVCTLPIILKAKKDYFKNYKWQDNSTGDSLVVTNSGTYHVAVTDIFDNISSDTITITKDTTAYVVKLGNDTAVCNGQSVKLVAGPSHLSYLWSTGSTENSITVNTSGNYSVSVTNCLGNISKDTIHVNVHPIPVFNLGKDTLICFNTPYTIDPGLLNAASYSFKWFDGSTDTVHAVTHGGQYYVSVKDNIGCTFSDTIHIKVDSLLSTVTLGTDTSFCSGNVIGLQKGSGNVVSYLWSTASTTPTIPVFTTGDYWLTVKSVNNCQLSDTIHVTVSGKAPVANFSFSNTCLKNVTLFSDLSVPPSGEAIQSWSWTFGDSSVSVDANPTHVYADTGKYTVQLKVTTFAGCSATFTKVVTVFPRPKMNFLTSTLCEDINVLFTGQAITYGAAITKWNWNFADPASGAANASFLQNPFHIFASGGIYPVMLIGENVHGCADTLIKNVVINQAPVTDFSFSLACKDDTVLFKDLTVLPSGTSNISDYWSFGNGTSTLLNPVHVFPANVKYAVMHVVTASNGCKDTVIKTVDVHASPTAHFANSNSCELNSTSFTDQSIITIGSITAWKWTFENIGYSTVQNPQYSFKKPGNALVKEVVISNFGCKDSVSKTIVVYPKPVAQFTWSPEYGNPGQQVKFTNTSTGAASYLWNFDDGGASTTINPTHIYVDTGSYIPFLIAKSTVGCTDTVFGHVLILKRYLDVAITGTTAQIQNGGGLLLNDYLNVSVNLMNKSTADVFALELYMEANDGPAIKETWTGKFLKGSTMGYDFKTTPSLKPGDHFVCVYALNPNGLKDELPIDNKLCKALDQSVFKVLAPYPNPTEDLMEIPLIIPTGGKLIMTMYDSKGREIRKLYDGMINQGLQLITIDTRDLNAGLYVCKVQLEEQTIFTKFIKK